MFISFFYLYVCCLFGSVGIMGLMSVWIVFKVVLFLDWLLLKGLISELCFLWV